MPQPRIRHTRITTFSPYLQKKIVESNLKNKNTENVRIRRFVLKLTHHVTIYSSVFQPFVYGGTLFSYLNFRDTPIILVDNTKVFTENSQSW